MAYQEHYCQSECSNLRPRRSGEEAGHSRTAPGRKLASVESIRNDFACRSSGNALQRGSQEARGCRDTRRRELNIIEIKEENLNP